MFKKRTNGSLVYYTSPVLDKFGINHGFFTRLGGVSDGDFSSLNVSTTRKDSCGNLDSPENVRQNYSLALSVFGAECENSVGTKQVHENAVRCVGKTDGGRGILSEETVGCDGLYLGEDASGIKALCVKTADCVPLLLSSKDGKQISAVHAGWRGTVADIAVEAAKKFSCDKSNILVAIGPCINVCCYEIGSEVYEAVKSLFTLKGMAEKTDEMFAAHGDRINADIALINKTLLTNFGIPEENIDVSSICTCCSGDEFFSHRGRHGHSGTFVSVISR